MSDAIDYKNIGNEFRQYASKMLNTEYTNPDVPLYRFKNFIDENSVIKDIINLYINGIDYDYTDMVKDDGGWRSIAVPFDERKHFKGMYDYMTYIVDNELSVESLSFDFYCSSRNRTDIIRNFINIVFKEMVDIIKKELESRIINNEKSEKNMFSNNINGNKNKIKITQTQTKNGNKESNKKQLIEITIAIVGVIVAIIGIILGS